MKQTSTRADAQATCRQRRRARRHAHAFEGFIAQHARALHRAGHTLPRRGAGSTGAGAAQDVFDAVEGPFEYVGELG